MATEKKSPKKVAAKKQPVKKKLPKKSMAKKPIAKKRVTKKKRQAQLVYTLNSKSQLTLDGLQKWTKFVGIMNIIAGIIYCLTIFIFSIPTVIMGVVTILMGSKLTVAANHLSFAMQNEDNESFQIALDQLHRYFLINGILFIITIIFILILVVIASLFAGILIEFINESGFNYSISLLTKVKYIY